MFTLEYNGYDVPLQAAFSCRFSFKNPACFLNEIPGASALGIEIPVTEYSIAIFGSPHRFEKYGNGSDRKFANVDLRFKGFLLLSGTLNIINASAVTYSAWLQGYIGAVGEEQREKFIVDLDWSKFEDKSFDNKQNYDDDSDDYCQGQLINRRFWDDIGKKITEEEDYYNDEGEKCKREIELSQLAAYHRDNYDWEINSGAGGIARHDKDGAVVSPFLFLKFLLKNVLKQCDFFIDNSRNCFNDLPQLKNLAFYNNFNIMQPEFTIKGEYLYETDQATGKQYIIGYNKITSIQWQILPFKYISLIPKISIKDLILSLQNLLNVVFVFDVYNKVSIIDREIIITGDSIDLDSYFLGDWIIGERKNLSLQFSMEYDKDDSIVADNYHDLTERRTDFKESVNSFSDLENIVSPAFGEIRHCQWEDEYWEYKWDVIEIYNEIKKRFEHDVKAWVYASSGPQSAWLGTGETVEEIKTSISTLYSHFKTNGIAALQKGTFSHMRSLWNNFSARLFFFGGNGTVDVRNGDLSQSLRWYGEDGLLKNRWPAWAAFWINRLPVEGEFDLPLNIIYMLINNITSKYRTRNGEFVIEEMEVEISLNTIGKTKIKGYKV